MFKIVDRKKDIQKKTIENEEEIERDYEMECLRDRTASTEDLLNAIERMTDKLSEINAGVSVVKTFIYSIYIAIAWFFFFFFNDHFHILQHISENI